MALNETRLETWKQIAGYLDKDVRTVIRWEKERGLPVHRVPGEKRSVVYAWPSEVTEWLKSSGALANGTAGGAGLQVSAASAPPGRGSWILASIITALLAAAGAVLSFWPTHGLPQVVAPIQLTSDGEKKGWLTASATALYVTQGGGIIRMDQHGGNPFRLSFKARATRILDVSSDGSLLLVIDPDALKPEYPLWLVPTDGGPSRRLADLEGSAAGWSRNGRELAYTKGRELLLADADGAGSRRLVVLPYAAWALAWSPDGSRICLVLAAPPQVSARLWEVSTHSRTIVRLLPGWTTVWSDEENEGRWTPNREYFVFGSFHRGEYELWACRELDSWFPWRTRHPFLLIADLNGLRSPAFSKDGKRLFVLGYSSRHADLMRYDPATRRFLAYPDAAGLSGGHVSFSRDGKEAVYVTYPDMNLWRMNADGSGRRMLTDHAALPQWSPNDRRIAFMRTAADSHKPTKIGVISSDGGTVQEPVRSPEWQGVPTWSADGKALIFGDNAFQGPLRESCSIHRFDFASGKTSDFPNTSGLWTARACPTGRWIAALTRDNRKLVLYDERTAARIYLASFAESVIGDNPTWSSNGKFIYFDVPNAVAPAIYRIAVPSGRKKRVASLEGIHRVRSDLGLWIGLTPDNLPLVVREADASEIYAWDWIEP
ncbi:MAG TPA: hypothetical protein VMI94_04410 [Bryobacteraceae bacterium]|nr:hypothetical protein [Bryobacteraceae bacterium]